MTNELFPSNEQEMNEQDEVLREEERITQDEVELEILFSYSRTERLWRRIRYWLLRRWYGIRPSKIKN